MNNKIYTSIKDPKRVNEKRQEIVNAVVKLFIQKGYERTSMREICEATGMTMGSIYDYIGKKEDLLYLVHDHMMKGIYNRFEGIDQREFDSLNDLKYLMKEYFLHSLKYKKEILLTYRENWLLKEEEKKALLDKQRSYIAKMRKFIDKGVEKGILQVQDTHLMASFILYVIAMPSLRSWDLGPYKGREEDMIDILVDIIIKAISI